jgi:hypothetical protein
MKTRFGQEFQVDLNEGNRVIQMGGQLVAAI